MTIKHILFVLFLFTAACAAGQLSLKNPNICHDKDKYLRCYKDGSFILSFRHGSFEELRTVDSSVKYSNINKEFIFFQKSYLTPNSIDTVRLKLLPNSVVVQRGNKSLEVTSVSQIPLVIHDFGVGNYSIDGRIEGFAFYFDDKYFKIKISPYGKVWSWDIKMWRQSQVLSILHNSFKKNRLTNIFIMDTVQKYGMALSTTFRSLKKISRLHSSYVDTMTLNGITAIVEYPLDKYYNYDYNKGGKLKSKTLMGELKLCDCDQ